MTLTVSELRAQVEAVLERGAGAEVVGIYAPSADPWPETLDAAGRSYRVRWCPSPLAARMALRDVRRSGTEQGLLMLTSLTEQQLGADVVARLARGKLFRIRQWEIVRSAFRAQEVDGRLARHGWMADLLIQRRPAGGYDPVGSRVLDADTAWRALLLVTLGLDTGRPDADEWLQWTLDPQAGARWRALPDEAQRAIAERVAETAGPAGALITGAVRAGFADDVLPLGLVADLLSRDDVAGHDVIAARARIERYVSTLRFTATAGRRWADAAMRRLRALPEARARTLLARADELAGDLLLASQAVDSDVLPSGFEARLEAFARQLEAIVVTLEVTSEATSEATPERARLAGAALEATAARVLQHAQAGSMPARVECVQMATRLARWLALPATPADQFLVQARHYAADGAFVDWARLKVGDDPGAALTRAFRALSMAVQARRDAQNRRFAAALQQWTAASGAHDALPGVEQVIDRVVGPLADAAPVLWLVVDGLSLGLREELASSLSAAGWTSLVPEQAAWSGAAVAALPTVTEISRASLLAGRLARGAQSFERSAFLQHPALAARTRPHGPSIFHKGELADGPTLSVTVREAVADPAQRVIAVVFNAIDDQLDGAMQLNVQWSLEHLPPLPALLHEARGARRLVIVTADHGHVLERGTTEKRVAGRPENGDERSGDRWRMAAEPPGEGELTLEGSRVLTAAGAHRVTVAWSETLRYGAKKNGYHGGATPQEVLVPLMVLAPTGMPVAGWKPSAVRAPDWWNDPATAPAAAREPAVAPRAAPRTVARPAADSPQPDLFGAAPLAAPGTSQPAGAAPAAGSAAEATAIAAAAGPAPWIDALLASTAYRTQRTLAARVAPPDEAMRVLLQALTERGGKLSRAALAARLELAPMRVAGFVAAARRLLNIDQAPVLAYDDASDTVELNRTLLEAQFGLRRGPSP